MGWLTTDMANALIPALKSSGEGRAYSPRLRVGPSLTPPHGSMRPRERPYIVRMSLPKTP